MKQLLKCFPTLVAILMQALLVGCGSPVTGSSQSEATSLSSTASQEPGQPATVRSTAVSKEENSSAQPTAENTSATSLVVYFSWSGNTEQMAGWIADESGGDLYRVNPKEAYGKDFDSCADRAKNELDNGIRPELADLLDVETMAQYDTIFVGFPIWWYDLPMVMTAFLENYDLSGKTIVPFFSHNGSSSGASAPETLTKICTGATVLTDQALSLSGSEVENSESQIRNWVGSVKQ